MKERFLPSSEEKYFMMLFSLTKIGLGFGRGKAQISFSKVWSQHNVDGSIGGEGILIQLSSKDRIGN